MSNNPFKSFMLAHCGKITLLGVLVLIFAYPVTDFFAIRHALIPSYVGGLGLFLLGLLSWDLL